LGPAKALDMHVSRSKSLGITEWQPLWQACRCRALRVKVDASITVGHGYVGYSVP
jgi:hypothetical protein